MYNFLKYETVFPPGVQEDADEVHDEGEDGGIYRKLPTKKTHVKVHLHRAIANTNARAMLWCFFCQAKIG